MNKRLLNTMLIGSMILLTGVTTSACRRWSRVTPQGTGFSVDVITVGPKGARDTDAERFVRSFCLAKTEAGAAGISHASSASSTSPLVGKMASSILVVARLINEERLSPLIDTAVRNVPPVARLGDRWNPSNAAWQEARSSFIGRIDAVADAYEKSGEIERALESELGALAPESRAAIAAALNGPAGPAILSDLGKFQFILTIMGDDPNGPKPGDPARHEQMRALKAAFEQRVGPAPSLGDGTHKADAEAFFSGSSGNVFLQLWDAVLLKATLQLKGGSNGCSSTTARQSGTKSRQPSPV